jgi:hypothetical protein
MTGAVAAALAALGLTLAACGGGDGGRRAIEVPPRTATAADPLLALAPLGADAILEIDLARLRGNPVIGPLAEQVLPRGAGLAGTAALIGAADAMLIASYGLGEGRPRTLVLARGGRVGEVGGGAVAIGRGAVALGEPDLIDRASAVAGGAEPPLASDRSLLALRAQAMPAGADGAALRMTARLGFEARLALARELEIDAVPLTISAWADVVDDLAVIALLGGEKPADTKALRDGAAELVGRLARGAPLYGRLLSRELGRTRVEAKATTVQMVLVIGPRRLSALVGRALRALGPRAPTAAAPAGEGT